MLHQSEIPDDRLRGLLDFLEEAARLKDTMRSGVTAGGRRESSAEHSWRLCLMVCLFEDALVGIDMARLLKLCVVHDLGEAISGDIPAPDQGEEDGRHARERQGMETLCAALPDDIRHKMMALWDEYAAGETPEAVLAKGFDKLETIIQHQSGRNGPEFDHRFNLDYGRAQTDRHPLLRQLRDVVDAATRQRLG